MKLYIVDESRTQKLLPLDRFAEAMEQQTAPASHPERSP